MHQFTRVKICGLTKVEDAQHAVAVGADAIGLVFYEKSPRNISIKDAAAISKALPAFVSSVALFKDADASFIENILEKVPVDLIQFHGAEPAEFCRQFNKPYIKAFAMHAESDLSQQVESYHDAKAMLLDSHAPGEDGGSGETFDWSMIPDNLPLPMVLAGGLNSSNVAQAIQTVKPYAVDVSSGVEVTKGIKDAALMTAFMNEVNNANC